MVIKELPPVTRSQGRNPISHETMCEIVHDYNAGLTRREIAAKHGVSTATVGNVIRTARQQHRIPPLTRPANHWAAQDEQAEPALSNEP